MKKEKEKNIGKGTKTLGVIIAALFLIGVLIVIFSSILRAMGATEVTIYEKDGTTLIVYAGEDVYTIKEPSIGKYEVKDEIYVLVKKDNAKIIPSPELLERISLALMICPFLLSAIFIIIRNIILNIRFVDTRVFKAIIFITVVYAISVGFMLLAIGSFYGPVDMLVVNYAIAAYMVLITFVIYITSEKFKRWK